MQATKNEPKLTDDNPTHVLARLELGFRTDSVRLKALEKDLAETLQCARQFVRKHGLPDDWDANWQQQWNAVEGILHRTRGPLSELYAFIECNDRDQHKQALAAWETIQSEDANLVEALDTIRTQAGVLNVTVRKDWNVLARKLEFYFETIRACAQTLRIRLELSKRHSKEEVEHLIRDILAKLPNRIEADWTDAASYEQEYRKAITELEQERHRFLGFMDVVKGLLMWIETTEERVRRNLSLRVDEK